MKALKTKQSFYLQDNANRVGGFELLPTQLLLPNITIQPINGFSQNTWFNTLEHIPGELNVVSVDQFDNIITMLPNTQFSLFVGLSTDDPTTLNRYPYDVYANVQSSFKWKRDGQYLFQYNSLNDGNGTQTLVTLAKDCTVDISGIYVCEITNGYGTVETEPVEIIVLDIPSHPLLHKNILVNGDGNLSGWSADFDIKTSAFTKDIYKSKNFGSIRLTDAGITLPAVDENGITDSALLDDSNFYFCIAPGDNLFPSIYSKANAGIKDYNTSGPLLPQIIPNESYFETSQYAGFFPSPYTIDKYNKNNNTFGLVDELNIGANLYFTRDKIKFEKFGGTSEVKMSQVIDLSEVSDLIDGKVYGVSGLKGQFFAYIGAGLTGYDISYIDRKGDEQTLFGYGMTPQELAKTLLNYQSYASSNYTQLASLYLNTDNATIKDGALLNGVVDAILKAGYPTIDSGEAADKVDSNYGYIIKAMALDKINGIKGNFGFNKKVLKKNTQVNVIPKVNDKTKVVVDYLDVNNVVLDTSVINGPSERDVWAIKEKVYFPLAQFTIDKTLNTGTDNSIGVFNQTYYKGGVTRNNYLNKLLSLFSFGVFGGSYPSTKNYFWLNPAAENSHVVDRGAAAMFGVNSTTNIPIGTRSARVTVYFTHTSNIFKDNSPELRGWTDQEIYSTDYASINMTDKPLSAYGNPRCGITKMKFTLGINNFDITDKYGSYYLPPPNKSILEKSKLTYGDPNYYDTSLKDAVAYTYITVDSGD